MSKTKTQRKDCSVRKRMKKNVKRNTYINPVVCCSCCFLLHVMLWQEVFSCLTLASRQHGVSQTCRLIITQLRMKSMWWKALCPFPFSETGSESKQQREVIPFSFCIHLRTSLPWSNNFNVMSGSKILSSHQLMIVCFFIAFSYENIQFADTRVY